MPTAGKPSNPFVRNILESELIKFSNGTSKSISVSSSKKFILKKNKNFFISLNQKFP